MKKSLMELMTERDRLKKRLDLINVRCDARNRLEAQICRLDVRIAQIASQSA